MFLIKGKAEAADVLLMARIHLVLAGNWWRQRLFLMGDNQLLRINRFEAVNLRPSPLYATVSHRALPMLMLEGGLGFCLLFMVSHMFRNGSEWSEAIFHTGLVPALKWFPPVYTLSSGSIERQKKDKLVSWKNVVLRDKCNAVCFSSSSARHGHTALINPFSQGSSLPCPPPLSLFHPQPALILPLPKEAHFVQQQGYLEPVLTLDSMLDKYPQLKNHKTNGRPELAVFWQWVCWLAFQPRWRLTAGRRKKTDHKWGPVDRWKRVWGSVKSGRYVQERKGKKKRD